MKSAQILNVWLDEMLDGMRHNIYEVANANRLCQKCIIQKAILVEGDCYISEWFYIKLSTA